MKFLLREGLCVLAILTTVVGTVVTTVAGFILVYQALIERGQVLATVATVAAACSAITIYGAGVAAGDHLEGKIRYLLHDEPEDGGEE